MSRNKSSEYLPIFSNMVSAPLSSQSREEDPSTGCNGNGDGRCNGNRGDAHSTVHNGDNGKSGTGYGDVSGGGNDFKTGFDDRVLQTL